ncbi:Lrp/AsnC family transcriptional regulator [Aliivibrio salmonicida]|jgi:DNA-binding Lrp family transcriptional regulator|uniref:Leucine-responsive regulatory protein n=1 Tax=Aliivibrio salmonicida (strain LFI1238) TaxID=316275 RepID=B6ESU8_ALISL|nr:Lrp/AsnC family transcriptional regulator [Aliivibrio salmonicida]AZL87063.1 Lrp/AsnC family transcriptional regulator [Aliivibrio salmonicida]CAQ81796.1 HTH-type transcriptional regulator, AsnC family [Aliivibrio salmonicida LFI1238]
MDRFDERILQELKLNGRLTNVELSERIGLSPSATLRRVQELERSNTIQGYRAVLNPNKCGIGFIAYVTIGLSNHSKKSQKEFEAQIMDSKEVVECHNITGSNEYLLRVETESLQSYKHFHSNVLGEISQVNAIGTLVVMDTPKDERT